jgi:hypothetical protein
MYAESGTSRETSRLESANGEWSIPDDADADTFRVYVTRRGQEMEDAILSLAAS